MTQAVRAVILGAGGHARVLMDVLQCQGQVELVGILDPDAGRWGTELLGVRILGGDDRLPELLASGTTHFAIGVAGVGPSPVRARLFEMARQQGLKPLTAIHPSAVVSAHADLSAGAQIFPGAVVNAGARIGENAIVNSGAIVEHDCAVGPSAHVACGACLAGGVVVGPGAFVGAGATVIQGIRIGANALVAAGAVAIRDVPENALVAGVPARILPG